MPQNFMNYVNFLASDFFIMNKKLFNCEFLLNE